VSPSLIAHPPLPLKTTVLLFFCRSFFFPSCVSLVCMAPAIVLFMLYGVFSALSSFLILPLFAFSFFVLSQLANPLRSNPFFHPNQPDTAPCLVSSLFFAEPPSLIQNPPSPRSPPHTKPSLINFFPPPLPPPPQFVQNPPVKPIFPFFFFFPRTYSGYSRFSYADTCFFFPSPPPTFFGFPRSPSSTVLKLTHLAIVLVDLNFFFSQF